MLNYASYCVLKADKVLMFCQDFYAQFASRWDNTYQKRTVNFLVRHFIDIVIKKVAIQEPCLESTLLDPIPASDQGPESRVQGPTTVDGTRCGFFSIQYFQVLGLAFFPNNLTVDCWCLNSSK